MTTDDLVQPFDPRQHLRKRRKPRLNRGQCKRRIDLPWLQAGVRSAAESGSKFAMMEDVRVLHGTEGREAWERWRTERELG